MGKYNPHPIDGDGVASEYEDDEGMVYRPKRELGRGINAYAREFCTAG